MILYWRVRGGRGLAFVEIILILLTLLSSTGSRVEFVAEAAHEAAAA